MTRPGAAPPLALPLSSNILPSHQCEARDAQSTETWRIRVFCVVAPGAALTQRRTVCERVLSGGSGDRRPAADPAQREHASRLAVASAADPDQHLLRMQLGRVYAVISQPSFS
eukprot:1068937-Prymnesium_polylepis.1